MTPGGKVFRDAKKVSDGELDMIELWVDPGSVIADLIAEVRELRRDKADAAYEYNKLLSEAERERDAAKFRAWIMAWEAIGELHALIEVGETGRLRRELAAERKAREAAERLVEEFQDASGLCVPAEERGGDPGGVKPAHVSKYIEAAERRAELAEQRLRAAEMVCKFVYSKMPFDELPYALRPMLIGWANAKDTGRNGGSE